MMEIICLHEELNYKYELIKFCVKLDIHNFVVSVGIKSFAVSM